MLLVWGRQYWASIMWSFSMSFQAFPLSSCHWYGRPSLSFGSALNNNQNYIFGHKVQLNYHNKELSRSRSLNWKHKQGNTGHIKGNMGTSSLHFTFSWWVCSPLSICRVFQFTRGTVAALAFEGKLTHMQVLAPVTVPTVTTVVILAGLRLRLDINI